MDRPSAVKIVVRAAETATTTIVATMAIDPRGLHVHFVQAAAARTKAGLVRAPAFLTGTVFRTASVKGTIEANVLPEAAAMAAGMTAGSPV